MISNKMARSRNTRRNKKKSRDDAQDQEKELLNRTRRTRSSSFGMAATKDRPSPTSPPSSSASSSTSSPPIPLSGSCDITLPGTGETKRIYLFDGVRYKSIRSVQFLRKNQMEAILNELYREIGSHINRDIGPRPKLLGPEVGIMYDATFKSMLLIAI